MQYIQCTAEFNAVYIEKKNIYMFLAWKVITAFIPNLPPTL